MNDLLKQLQALAPLAAAATPGEWHNSAAYPYNEGQVLSYLPQRRNTSIVANCRTTNYYAAEATANATFIAAARNVLTPENLAALIGALAHVAIPEFQVGDIVEIVASRDRALPYGLGTLAQVKRYNYGLNEVVVKHHNSDYLTSYNAANVVVVKAKTTTMAPVADWVSTTTPPAPCDTPNGPAPFSPDVLLWINENEVPIVGYYDYRAGYDCYQTYGLGEVGTTHWALIVPPTAPAPMEGAQPHV